MGGRQPAGQRGRTLRGMGLVMLMVATSAAWAGGSPLRAGDRYASERLTYNLTYRGLLTSFIGKNLAQVEMFAFAKPAEFNGDQGCRVAMTVDTEGYDFSEFMYPVRFRWESIVTPDLQRTLLVEEFDKGKDDDHRFYWMNWPEGAFSIYRKRELRSTSHSVWDEDYTEPVWEGDDGTVLPPFLTTFPAVENGKSYFLHKKTLKDSEHRSGIDGLTLIYRARRADLTDPGLQMIPVIHDGEVEMYRLTLLGQESIESLGQQRESDHVLIENVDLEKHSKGRMEIWLSRDDERVPLRLEVHAPVGKVSINLSRRQGSLPLEGCLGNGADTAPRSAGVGPLS